MKLRKHSKLATICALTVLAVSGCATNTAGTDCLVFRPIYFSERDTEETIEQVLYHNAAWEAVCE